MNKTSILPKCVLTHVIYIFIFSALISSEHLQIAKADGAPPPDPTVGGVGPYQPIKTNVQMMSETVFIDVPRSPANIQEPKQIHVNASFTMRNQGKSEEQMQVIFPLTRLNMGGSEQALYQVDTLSFVAKVQGKKVPFTTITTPAEETISGPDSEHGFSSDVQWAAFEVTFPVQKDVLLEVEYEMLNPYGEYGEGFTGIAYILETGAGWYGNILSADITLRLPYRVTEEAILYANPGYVISGREMRWKLKDFEPTRENNLEVRVIHVDTWQAILKIQSRVEQNPNDVDGWIQLADCYTRFGIIHTINEDELPYGLNHRLSNLALEARQRIVQLRPQSGDAHYKLAEILWYTNPKVEKLFDLDNRTKTFIQPDDPSIQGVLNELNIVWSYGLSENISFWEVRRLVQMINRAVPNLNLAIPESVATTVPPTETLIPFPTSIPSPTASPTLAPTVSPTLMPTITLVPIPIKISSSSSDNLLIIAIAAILIGVGMLIYKWKLKRER